ncbi:unnamed protein product, partial [Tetraodon nigroviridis]
LQMENGILLPTLQSALPFLDLHGTPRLEFHQSVFDELRENLMERVAVIAEGKEADRYSKLEELLEKSFPLVKMPSIQPVVMQVLKHLPKVPEKKLKIVMADKELYKVCAVEVKRQIWQDNQALFGDEVSPLLKQYIVEKEAALFSSDVSVLHSFFSPSPKTRRQGEVVLKLTQMIGKNVKLYDMFTWCLDACIREKFVDGKRARELQGFLDGGEEGTGAGSRVRKGGESLGRGGMRTRGWNGPFVRCRDLSMILCDPFACNTLVLSIMRNLQELLSQDALPRDSPDLMLLLRMLSLGQGAWDMIDSQVFKEPRLDKEVVTCFLPAMMSVVVDDNIFTVEQKLPSEEKSSQAYPTLLPDAFYSVWLQGRSSAAVAVTPDPGPETGSGCNGSCAVSFFFRFLRENRVACEMGLYYIFHIAKLRNKNALQRLLPALVDTYNDMAFGDIFLHLLTGHLTLLSDEFGSEDFCSVVFDGFLLTSFSSKENVHRHILRMLVHLHHKVAPSCMESLMKTLEPPKQVSADRMGKVKTFDIFFDHDKTEYSSGDSVSGSVKVELSGPLLCKAIKINCCGFCGVTNKVNDTSWNVEEQYFNSTISVADKGTLKQGKHVFPFKFLLPASCPTSFEGKYGRIIYRVRAVIDTPRFVTDYSAEKPFYLLNLLNLNQVPDIWGVSSSAVTKEFSYMLMKSGTVVLKAQTDMKGYTPGQIIQVKAHISNQSGKSTGHMAASLVQNVSYGTKKPTHDVRTIAEVEGGVVKPGKEVEWKEQIIVPPLPQSSLAGCELIKVEYYVKVRAPLFPFMLLDAS